MTTVSNEEFPVMPDVRATQREARRIAAILKWPVHLIFAVLFTVWTGIWLGGLYVDKGAGIMLIIFGLCICVMTLFRKQILRAFLGAQTPMIFEKNTSGPLVPGAKRKITWIAGMVAGGVIGFLAAKLLERQGEDVEMILILSCFTGAGIAHTFNEWLRTHLWEFILSLVLQIAMLAILQTFRALDSRAILIIFPFAIFHSCVFAISFYLRWRKWVKSLPETVKSEEA